MEPELDLAQGRIRMSGIKECKYFEHVERPADAALGVRVVEWLRLAYNKDAPLGWHEVVVYRPLDQEAHVYKVKAGWDYRPLGEFLWRYHPIHDEERIAKLDELAAHIYDTKVWVEYRFKDVRKD